MILETIEILDSNLTLTLEQLQTKVTNGDYDDLLNTYNLLIMISDGLVLISKSDKSCKVIAPIDLEKYIKNTDIATNEKLGLVKYNNAFGVSVNTNGQLNIYRAYEQDINSRESSYKPIVPCNLDYAVRSVYPIVQSALTDPITVNTVYNLGAQTDLSLTLPSGQIGDFIQVDFISGSTATSLTIESSSGLTDADLTPQSNTIYSLYFDWGAISYDGTDVSYGWRCNYYEYPIEVV